MAPTKKLPLKVVNSPCGSASVRQNELSMEKETMDDYRDDTYTPPRLVV